MEVWTLLHSISTVHELLPLLLWNTTIQCNSAVKWCDWPVTPRHKVFSEEELKCPVRTTLYHLGVCEEGCGCARQELLSNVITKAPMMPRGSFFEVEDSPPPPESPEAELLEDHSGPEPYWVKPSAPAPVMPKARAHGSSSRLSAVLLRGIQIDFIGLFTIWLTQHS